MDLCKIHRHRRRAFDPQQEERAGAEGEDHKEKAHGTGHHSNGKDLAANKAYARDASGRTHCNEFVADAVEKLVGDSLGLAGKQAIPQFDFLEKSADFEKIWYRERSSDWSKQIGKMFGQLQDLLTKRKASSKDGDGDETARLDTQIKALDVEIQGKSQDLREVLNKAQQRANDGNIVIAASRNPHGSGHIALVVPLHEGDSMKESGQWGRI